MTLPFSRKQSDQIKKDKRFSLLNFSFYLVGPVLIIIFWQYFSMKLGQKWILPSPLSVVRVLLHPCSDILSSGSLFKNTLISLIRVIMGFTIAAFTGVFLGILTGTTEWIRKLLTPIIEILRPLCPIAWMPFAIAVFKMQTLPQLVGIDYSKTILDQVQIGMLFVLFWGAFFPILINTSDGIQGIRKNYIILAQSLGADKKTLIFRVYLPAALPMIITGLRQGLALCWFVIIAAEMLPGSNSGIGYLLFYASDLAEMPVVIACMIIIGLIGAILNGLMLLIMKRFISWHGKEI